MFSALIPSFNHRHFLLECTLSALRSPLVTEVLIVDDGSSDRSPELFPLLERLGPRVRILPNEAGENRGAHNRINQLIEAASNPWVAVLNSDDQFAAGRFEAIQRTVQRGMADLIFGNLVLIDGQGARLGERNAIWHNEIPWPRNWHMDSMARAGEWPAILCLQNIMATTTNMVFTKDLHTRLGGFRDYRYCHDWDFALRAALVARVHYAPAMLAMYRLHQGNTIKEAAERVQREVRRMLAAVVHDMPALRDDPALRAVLAGNHYLAPSAPPPLALAIPDALSRGLIQNEIEQARLPVLVVAKPVDAPLATPYVYEPGTAALAALRMQDLRAILLALATEGHDALLLNRGPGPGVDEAGLADALVLRRGAAGRWRDAAWPVRLYPATAPAAEGPPIPSAAITRGRPPATVPMPAPLLDPDPRPVVFILPAFLAVGGVERLVLETMKHLAARWRFVIITTEPLRPEQGSTHDEARRLATIYDLAELTAPETRLRAFDILRDWHAPALIWIVNGAPWQVQHAAELRRMFADIPIIDHQAYDHDAGWINSFSDPAIRASDRFVAINQKIRSVMQTKHGIPADRIDLIYHGSDMARVQRRDVDAATIAAHRARFGLDPARPLFGMIGRLTAQKRPLDLVALAKRIGPKIQFCWVGLGELEADMQSAAKRVPNFTLIPGQTDLRPIYEMLDGMIVTSEFEGLPIVLIEALAMGLPALSTDVGAIKEVLDRYGSGQIYTPPGDSAVLEAAFKTFRKVLPTLRVAATQQAAQIAEDFSSARMARDYEASFHEALLPFATTPGFAGVPPASSL